jgi:hypothetical protein
MFVDHYLDVEYDLSRCSSSPRPTSAYDSAALQDRMEADPLSGYTISKSSESPNAFWSRSRPNRPAHDKDIVFTDEDFWRSAQDTPGQEPGISWTQIGTGRSITRRASQLSAGA